MYRTTKLTKGEISRMSKVVGVEWNGLAGLMDIPYSEREEIRKNQARYPDSFSKAEKIFLLFNDREDFCRRALEKWVKELNLHDVKKEMLNIDEVYLLFISYDNYDNDSIIFYKKKLQTCFLQLNQMPAKAFTSLAEKKIGTRWSFVKKVNE